MNRKLLLFLVFACILMRTASFAQNSSIDSFLTVFKNSKNDSVRLNSLYSLANIYHVEGDYANSLKYHFLVLKISEAKGQLKHVGAAYNNIGEIYRLQHKLPDGLKYVLLGLRIAEKIGDKKNIANGYNNTGLIYQELKAYDKALENHLAALAIRQKLKDKVGMAASFNNIGIVYDYQKDYEKAISNYLKAIKVNEELGNPWGIALSCINIGQLYMLLKRFPEASQYMNKGLQLAKGVKYKEYIMTAYASLAELYERQGNWEKAYKYHQLYTHTRDEIVSIEGSKHIAEMQTKYETEKKEQENLLLTRENKIKTLELLHKSQQRNIAIGIFSLFVIFGYFFFKQYKLKSENKLLQEKGMRTNAIFQAQEEEKIRISKDLHDGVGPLLSLIKLNISSIETNQENEEIIDKTKELASESIKEIRNISHSLLPGLLVKSGLQAAVAALVEQFNVGSVEIELDYQVSTVLRPEAEVNIYRIIQESINNILKHAGASKAKIQFEQKNQNILLSISDNGQGFDSDAVKMIAGNGLNNIYSRVDVMKGAVNVSSNAVSGTCFTIELPLKQITYA